MSTRRLAVVLAAALVGPAAAEVVVYRCQAADGSITLQNDRRCPKGSIEQKRVLETPRSAATPAAPAPVVPMPVDPATETATGDTPSATATAAPPVEAPTQPEQRALAAAPAVYACRTREGSLYYADTATPAPRCAPLQTVGLDGRTPVDAQACELQVDTCEPVAEAARCDAWAAHRRALETTAAFGDSDAAPRARDALQRLEDALAATVCAR